MGRDPSLQLNLRTQVLKRGADGRAFWECATSQRTIPASEVAVLICDMWDDHWSRGAAERCGEMAVRMNEVVGGARAHGVTIIHAPSDTMDFYAGTAARGHAIETPRVDPPTPLDRPDPPLPIDDSDEGSDTGGNPGEQAWTRQHPAIEIADDDYISDSGDEVYSILCARGIRQVVMMGVHTNMCVLHRSFGVKQMVRWGVDIALARDLTDTMYNPEMRPYVSHDEGTRLVVEFIEKFWCPSLLSSDLRNLLH
jgi:nicotinamidase-related amidase